MPGRLVPAVHRASPDAAAPPRGADRRGADASGIRAAHDSPMLGRASSYGNRMRETLGGNQAQEPVEVDELPTIEAVELQHRILRVVITKPPEPIGAFA